MLRIKKKKILNAIFDASVFVLFLALVEGAFIINKKYELISSNPFIRHTSYENKNNLKVPKYLLDTIASKWPQNVKTQINDKKTYLQRFNSNTMNTVSNRLFSLNHYNKNAVIQERLLSSPSQYEIYNATYKIDSFGRRQIPQQSEATQHMLFLGGSFTWGEGVNNDETFSYFLQQKKTKQQIYLIARPGFSANDHLQIIENNGWAIQGIKESNGIAVYFLIEDHFNRILPNSLSIRGKHYISKKPYYKKIDNSLIFISPFAESIYYKTISILSKSETLSFFNISFPLNRKEKSIHLMYSFLTEIELKLKQKFNTKELLLVILNKHSYGQELINIWIKENKKVIDLSNYEFTDTRDSHYFFPISPHPRPRTHWLYSELLYKELQKYGY